MALLKIAEVAQRLNYSESTVRRLIDDKKLAHHRCPGIRVSEEQLQEYLESTEVRTPDEGSKPAKSATSRRPALRHLRF